MSDSQKNQNTWNVGLAICKEFWIPGHTAVTFDIPESLRALSLRFQSQIWLTFTQRGLIQLICWLEYHILNTMGLIFWLAKNIFKRNCKKNYFWREEKLKSKLNTIRGDEVKHKNTQMCCVLFFSFDLVIVLRKLRQGDSAES